MEGLDDVVRLGASWAVARGRLWALVRLGLAFNFVAHVSVERDQVPAGPLQVRS